MKECGIGIVDVNPKYVHFPRESDSNFLDFYVSCLCKEKLRNGLCKALKSREYGAHVAEKMSPSEGKIICYIIYTVSQLN